MKNFRSVLLPLFFFAMVPIAKAGLLTFQFTGTVTQVPIDDLYGDIAFGDFVYGTYTFDGSAPDLVR
jgi:hypothetical protein